MAIDEAREFKPIAIALLTVSDTRGPADDTSGDILAERIAAAGHSLAARAIERDDAGAIAARLNHSRCPVRTALCATAGTGSSPSSSTAVTARATSSS